MLSYMLCVLKLDGLGSNLRQLVTMVDTLQGRGVGPARACDLGACPPGQ